MKTTLNDNAFDHGILAYTPLTTVTVNQTAQFYVTVIDVGKGAQLTSAPTRYHGQAVDPYDVPTAAWVQVQLVCSDDLECEDQADQDSQLVNQQHEGEWHWSVTAFAPGTTSIGIIAVTSREDGDTFTHSTPLWAVTVKVKAASP